MEQLRHLGVTLAAEAKVAEGIVGEPRPEPGPYVAVIVDRTRRWTANSMPHAPALAPSARQPDRHRGVTVSAGTVHWHHVDRAQSKRKGSSNHDGATFSLGLNCKLSGAWIDRRQGIAMAPCSANNIDLCQ